MMLLQMQDGYNTGDGIAWEKDPALNQTSYSYTATTTTITDPNGHATVYTYDSSGRVSQVKDALLDHEDYQYDSANNKTQVTDKRGHAWVYTYDTYGNLLTEQDPLSHTTTNTYNSHNKPLTTTLPSGRSIANTYDGSDNLTQVQEKDSGGTVKATTTLTYPATSNYGLPSSKTDTNSHTTSYAYDANGYLSSVTTPLGHQTQWTYDALGFRTSREDALSRTTTYTPDAWERLVTTTYPDTTTHTFTYDADSNLTGFSDPVTGPWFRTYDADDRMLTEGDYTTTLVSHTYDAAGQKGLLSTTTDYYGRTLTYAYSARNELSSVGEAAGTTTYAYDANGNQTHAVLPNGVHTDQNFNADNTLDSDYHGDGAGTIYQSYGYSYDADRRITSFNEGTSSSVHTTANHTSTAYTYDGQGHLSSESRTGTYPISQVYSYDGVGNRTHFNNGGDNPYTCDSDDEPTGAGGVNTFVLTYNANGDRTGETFNGQVTTFGYDFDDQLTSLSANGVTTTFQYDALGRQTRRTAGGTATVFYYDGAQVLFESNSDGSAETASYTWGNGLIRKDGEYPLTDGRGNVRLTTDSSRAVTSSNTPDAFGINSATSGSSSGYQWNGGAGYRTEGLSPTGMGSLYSFQKVGARYYDPTFGCFLTRDTYLDQKPYAYCDGDPVNEVDPDGHDPVPIGLKPGTDPSQEYRDYWPTQIWVHVGPPKVKGGIKVRVGPGEINGGIENSGPKPYPIDRPKYWNHLHPGTRRTIKNLADLQLYVQEHEGVPTH